MTHPFGNSIATCCFYCAATEPSAEDLMIAARRAHPKFAVCKSNSYYFSSDRSIPLPKTNSLTFHVYDRFQLVFEILRLQIY